MLAGDDEMRLTDVMDTEQILRLIQSVPSKKAEPFELWLADKIHNYHNLFTMYLKCATIKSLR